MFFSFNKGFSPGTFGERGRWNIIRIGKNWCDFILVTIHSTKIVRTRCVLHFVGGVVQSRKVFNHFGPFFPIIFAAGLLKLYTLCRYGTDVIRYHSMAAGTGTYLLLLKGKRWEEFRGCYCGCCGCRGCCCCALFWVHCCWGAFPAIGSQSYYSHVLLVR